ncbi:carbohydrate-binding protein [Streptosporangium canum]|uniref:carbohydrate-binding protein n=1 Tax=Streptosporangium canum TaxID=324952 RepID=UPI00379E7684
MHCGNRSSTAGAVVSCGGVNYRCLWAHTTRAGREPPVVPAIRQWIRLWPGGSRAPSGQLRTGRVKERDRLRGKPRRTASGIRDWLRGKPRRTASGYGIG